MIGLTLIIVLMAILLVALAGAPAMADVANRGVPGPQDSNLVIQAAVTKVADFDGAGLDLGEGFDPGGVGKVMTAVITVTAADRANSDETYAFHLEESDDNNTFVDCGVPESIEVSAATATVGVYVAKGIVTKRYVRLVLDVDGSTPSITYSAYLNPLA